MFLLHGYASTAKTVVSNSTYLPLGAVSVRQEKVPFERRTRGKPLAFVCTFLTPRVAQFEDHCVLAN